MESIEFHTTVKNGIIRIPAKYKNKLNKVRVVITPEDNNQTPDILSKLLSQPLKEKDFKPLGRDEAHARE